MRDGSPSAAAARADGRVLHVPRVARRRRCTQLQSPSGPPPSASAIPPTESALQLRLLAWTVNQYINRLDGFIQFNRFAEEVIIIKSF